MRPPCLFATATLALLSLDTLTAQEPIQPTILSDEMTNLLREPGGLQLLARKTGRLVLNGYDRTWSDLELSTQVSASDLILVGRVVSESSRLTESGHSIATNNLIQPLKTLKGSSPKHLVVTTFGGLVTFPGGTSAEEATITWQQLKVGDKFAFFLKREEDGYRPVNSFESLIRLPPHGPVDPLASYAHSPHSIVADVKNLPTKIFLQYVNAMVMTANTADRHYHLACEQAPTEAYPPRHQN
jgi:hypothetical protein